MQGTLAKDTKECIINTFKGWKFLFISGVIVLGTAGILFIDGAYYAYNSPYAENCWKLATLSDTFSVTDCVKYLNENPGMTGQEVIDHFERVALNET